MDNKDLIAKLNQIKLLVDSCLASLDSDKSNIQDIFSQKGLGMNANEKTDDIVLLVVNKIKNCPESEKIDSQILAKSAISGRVLLPYYICYKYFPERGLITGDVEKITSELRVRVKTPNVSNSITNSLWKYLDGDSSRVKGKPVIYKLNRKGANYFESLLNQNDKN